MLFQITITGKVPVTAQKFEDTTNTEPVAVFLLQNGIDTNKSPPSQVAQQVTTKLREEQALPEEQRTFTKEWQRLTGLDLRQMEAIVSEYERRQAFETAKMATEVRQAARNVSKAAEQIQDNEEYADRLGQKLNRMVRPRKAA